MISIIVIKILQNFFIKRNYMNLDANPIIDDNISDVIQIPVKQNYLLEILTTKILRRNDYYFNFVYIFDNYVNIQNIQV